MAQLGQTISMYQNLNPVNTNINEVAFSGSYTDLSGTPVISAVGHSGQYADVLNPPTRVSQFANDANYAAVLGENVSEFANNAGYITASQVPSNALQMRFVQNSSTGSATGGQYNNFSCSGGVQVWHASGTICVNSSGGCQVNLTVNGSNIGFVTPDNGQW